MSVLTNNSLKCTTVPEISGIEPEYEIVTAKSDRNYFSVVYRLSGANLELFLKYTVFRITSTFSC